jgi:hypothetical protein
MNKMSNVEVFTLVVLIFTTLFGVGMAGYNTGYKSGQGDALKGIYKYQLETNIVVNIKK